MVDLSKFKVIHRDHVLHAMALEYTEYNDGEWPGSMDDKTKTAVKPRFLTILCLDENGNIVTLRDEAWRFQFSPISHKGD